MATKNKEQVSNRKNITLKTNVQELNLTDLKELLQKSKKVYKKKDKTCEYIGYAVTTLGIISLISSLLINRLVDREYFPDTTIIFIMGVSIFTLLFGFYILIRETR